MKKATTKLEDTLKANLLKNKRLIITVDAANYKPVVKAINKIKGWLIKNAQANIDCWRKHNIQYMQQDNKEQFATIIMLNSMLLTDAIGNKKFVKKKFDDIIVKIKDKERK